MKKALSLRAVPGRAGFLFLLLISFLQPLQARPQVLVILADHLTLADVTRPNLPNLARLRREGSLALMSPGLAGKPDGVANVYATLGAGDTVRGSIQYSWRIRASLTGTCDYFSRHLTVFFR